MTGYNGIAAKGFWLSTSTITIVTVYTYNKLQPELLKYFLQEQKYVNSALLIPIISTS